MHSQVNFSITVCHFTWNLAVQQKFLEPNKGGRESEAANFSIYRFSFTKTLPRLILTLLITKAIKQANKKFKMRKQRKTLSILLLVLFSSSLANCKILKWVLVYCTGFLSPSKTKYQP